MSFRNKLQYFLVKKLQISNKEAQSLLFEERILVNGSVCMANVEIEPEDEIKLENEVLQASKTFKYIAFYKPKGIETTLNRDIPDNLLNILPFQDVFPIGRLDKASEGLLLLSDDGSVYDKVLRKENRTEKEYLVQVEKVIKDDFLEKMATGIEIMGKTTLPCRIEQLNSNSFRIILTQGLNRQIRRMCYKLGYEVVYLCRVKIGQVHLEDLKPGDWRWIEKKDIFQKLR